MQNLFFTALLNNAALLLALAVVYDFMTGEPRKIIGFFRQLLAGLILGCIGIGLMMAAIELSPGIVFDMRSVLLSLCGFFFGTIPALVAMTVTAVFRFYQGGTGVYVGITMIIIAGGLGLVWKYLCQPRIEEPSVAELFLFGAIVHFAMLISMLIFPLETALKILSGIGVLVMLICPVATVLLGRLLTNRHRRYRMATALEESETTYRTLFQNNHVAMLLLDPESGAILDANPAACRFYGWSREQLCDMNTSQINTLSEVEIQGKIKEVTGHGSLSHLFQHELADGSLRSVEVISGPVTINNQRLLYSIVHDVTERRQEEAGREKLLTDATRARRTLLSLVEDLKRTEARLELTQFTVDHLTDAAYWCKEDGRIFYINEASCQALGYSNRELLRMHIWDVFTDITKESWPQLREMIRKQYHVVAEYSNRRKNGSSFPVELKISYLTFEGRTAICGFAHDITKRKRSNATLRRLSTAIEQSPEAVVITDPDGNIQYVNPAFETTSGYSWKEVIGQTSRILKSGKHTEDFYADLWETIRSGKTWDGRFINKRKNGELYDEEANIAPVRNPSGTITGYVAVKKEITQELIREEQFRQSQKMEAVGQLAGGIAHDFNNILQAILGFSEVLLFHLDKDTDEHSHAFEISNAAKRAADLIKQLLAFSRKQPAKKTSIDLNTSVQETKVLLQVLLGKTIDCVLNLTPSLRRIEADHSQISQVIMNLTVNARDAMPEGGTLTITTRDVEISMQDAEKVPEATAGHFACLTVSDTGHGMSEEVKERLFEPFFTTKDVGKGTGLGLAVVYGVVHQNKGWIQIQSEENQGTSFNIYFPAMNP